MCCALGRAERGFFAFVFFFFFLFIYLFVRLNVAQAVPKWNPALTLHQAGFVCGCWMGAGRLQNYPLTGETGEAALALALPGRRRRYLPPPHRTRKSSWQLLCAALPEPFLQTPCPRVTSANLGWGSHPGGVELHWGYELSRWLFGFTEDQGWSQPPEHAKQDQQHQGDAAPAHVCADVPHRREKRTRANPPR